jgi:radical SAM superfamily enzyme YgiQ (UPF0313 family)
MKILLINPPRSPENSVKKYTPQVAKHFVFKLIGPPLGLLTVAGAVVNDYDVKILETKAEYDLNPDGPSLEVLVKNSLEDFKPDIVGVTFIASEFNDGIKIFKIVKKYNPDILTVAGGLHATLCPNDFNDKSVDIVCKGQAANIFRKIVDIFEKKGDFKKIGGILINSDKGLIPTDAPIEDWDPAVKNYIVPERSLIRKWLDAYKVGTQQYRATYLFTSLGCPYKCSFCSIWPQFDGKCYQRDIESIINELKTLDDYEVVRFADANTIIEHDFVDKLLNRIIEEKINKDYVMDVRFDTIVKYPKLIEKLAKVGLKVVICGFESFKNKELKKYKKGSNANLIEEAINILHQNEIMIRGNYVVPNYYNEDDFKALAQYAIDHNVVFPGYTILTPMPGTIFYEQMKDQIIDFDLSKYNLLNCVLKTKLSIEKFYENVGKLWMIKKGNEIINVK